MKINEFYILFMITGLALALIAVSPALTLISLPRSGERFSELWLLGPGHAAEGFPFNVSVNKQYRVYLGASNHLDRSGYYSIYVKFGNQTNQLPNSTTSEPSPLPPVYESRFALSDGDTWEVPLNFAFDYVLLQHNVTLLRNVSINGLVFPVDLISVWDSDINGFYFRMIFELRLYNTDSSNFQYHNRAVYLMMNMTSSQLVFSPESTIASE